MPEASPLRIGIVGTSFMGRAHSNAWLQAPRFFDLLRPIELRAACGRNRAGAEDFAGRWGWQSVETDWRALVARDDIDVIDVSVPQAMHAAVAIAVAGDRGIRRAAAAVEERDTVARAQPADAEGVLRLLAVQGDDVAGGGQVRGMEPGAAHGAFTR